MAWKIAVLNQFPARVSSSEGDGARGVGEGRETFFKLLTAIDCSFG
jgi:hypothetical protein